MKKRLDFRVYVIISLYNSRRKAYSWIRNTPKYLNNQNKPISWQRIPLIETNAVLVIWICLKLVIVSYYKCSYSIIKKIEFIKFIYHYCIHWWFNQIRISIKATVHLNKNSYFLKISFAKKIFFFSEKIININIKNKISTF